MRFGIPLSLSSLIVIALASALTGRAAQNTAPTANSASSSQASASADQPASAPAAQSAGTPATPANPHSIDVPDDTTPGASVQTLHVTSREVIVDVIVTDDKGHPVYNLPQSDFSISENGHPQTLRSFREVSADHPAPEPHALVLPPGIYTNSQSTPVSGPVNIFLVDALHMDDFSELKYSTQAVAGYIGSMPKSTTVAIFTIDENGLHMVQGFSWSPATALAALHNYPFVIGTNQERHTVQWYTIDALNQLAAYTAGVRGRKNLLWLAPGLPLPLLRDGGYGWGYGDMGMVHRIMDVYERFTAEQIAVSPVDARGLRVCPTCNLTMSSLMTEAVAEQSGGEAFFNTNDLQTAITQAINDQSHFYTLSYIPPRGKDDGHYHTIKVAVQDPNHPKLQLVYREGYNAERTPSSDSPAPGPALLKAAIEGNTPASTQILFDLGVLPVVPTLTPGQPQPASQPKNKSKLIPYDIYFGFPSNQIDFLEDSDGMLHGSLRFEAAAYNSDRKIVARFSQTIPLNLSPADFDDLISRPYRFHQQLELPPGPLSLHTGVLDGVSNKVGTLEVSVIAVKPRVPRPQYRSPAN